MNKTFEEIDNENFLRIYTRHLLDKYEKVLLNQPIKVRCQKLMELDEIISEINSF